MGSIQTKVETIQRELVNLMSDEDFVDRSGIKIGVVGTMKYPILPSFVKIPIILEHKSKLDTYRHTAIIGRKAFFILLNELVYLKSLVTLKDTEDELAREICGITLEDHPDTVLSCSHAYHGDALNTWMSKSDLCPLCPENIQKAEEYDTMSMTREDRESFIEDCLKRIYELLGAPR